MIQVRHFTFNPFQENTFLLIAKDQSCIIIDPGCHNPSERKALTDDIDRNTLRPVRLINTHCHIDHILGNAFVARQYNLGLEIPEGELPLLKFAKAMGNAYGMELETPPEPSKYIGGGQSITFGGEELRVLSTPGHSPDSICLYAEKSGFLIAGDVLFAGSIGRTDLPGGDHATLIANIKSKLLPLPDETIVYPGHGPFTTIGQERQHNPFLAQP